MTRVLFLMALTLSSLTALHAGDGAGTGGGLVEAQFTLAYSKMELFLRETISKATELKLSHDEVRALDRMLNLQYLELSADDGLKFETDPKKFEWQTTCSELKLAYTEMNGVGKPIHLNVSSFYVKKDERMIPVVDFSLITQLLVHELGHHAGFADHHWLDHLGTKVAGVAQKLMKQELENIEQYLERTAEVGIGAPRFFELSDFKDMKRQRLSGTFFPYNRFLAPLKGGAKAELFFLPNGGSRLFGITYADKSLSAAHGKEVNAATKGLPFRGSVEVVAVGKKMSQGGRIFLDTQSPDPDSYAVVSLWPSEEPDAKVTAAVFGTFGVDSAGRTYIEETKDGRYHRDYLKFVDPRFEKVLIDYLREYPRPFGIAFTTRPYGEDRPKNSAVETTTFLFYRK